MSIQQHPRTIICRQAENEAREALHQVRITYDLTQIEWLRLINTLTSDAISSYCKWELRIERHGNADTPGDIVGSGKKSPVSDDFVRHIIEHVGEAFSADPEMDVDVLFDTTKELMDTEFGE